MSERVTLGEWAGLPCHHWNDELPLLARFLGEARPPVVVELGTMYGGFAAFLADQVAPGGRVITVDRVLYPTLATALEGRRNLHFLSGDVFDPVVIRLLRSFLQVDRALVYCDDGDKERELEVYGGLLGPTSYIGVHDYGTEARPEFCEAWAARGRWRLALDTTAMEKPHLSRVWQRAA